MSERGVYASARTDASSEAFVDRGRAWSVDFSKNTFEGVLRSKWLYGIRRPHVDSF